AILLALPILGLALLTGVLVSLFQAVTQIQEVTLTFVPKMVAVAVAIAIFGPWMGHKLLEFTAALLNSLPTMIR
ncbi:MAG: flagellar biosynthetic protein FliQ, partial [Armatimonadetes bacterium]|nr:flagellar biosynthetic protein FliQ [Armatimonadota bacterium]